MVTRALLGHAGVMLLVHALGDAQRHAVLRPAWTRQAGLDRAEIELQHIGVLRRGGAVEAPESLRPRIVLDQLNLRGRAPRQLQVAHGLLVDRKDGAGAAEL